MFLELSDLINTRSKQLYGNNAFAEVVLSLKITVMEHNSQEEEVEETVKIRRRVGMNDTSQYFILQCQDKGSSKQESEQKSSRTAIQKFLKEFGVDLEFPERFIILQHQTLKLLQNKPRDLLEHLERLTGTCHFNTVIAELEETITREVEEQNAMNKQVFEFEEELDKLAPKATECRKFMIQLKNFQLQKHVFMHKVAVMQEVQLEQLKSEQVQLSTELNDCTSKFSKQSELLASLEQELINLPSEEEESNKLVANFSKKKKDLLKKISLVTVQRNTVEEELKELKGKRKEIKTNLSNSKTKVKSAQDLMQITSSKLQLSKDDLQALKSDFSHQESLGVEELQLMEQLKELNSNVKFNTLQARHLESTMKASKLQTTIQTLEASVKVLSTSISDMNLKVQVSTEEVKQLELKMNKLTAHQKQASFELKKIEQVYNDLVQKKQSIEYASSSKQSSSKWIESFTSAVESLKKSVPHGSGIHGTLSQVC